MTGLNQYNIFYYGEKKKYPGSIDIFMCINFKKRVKGLMIGSIISIRYVVNSFCRPVTARDTFDPLPTYSKLNTDTGRSTMYLYWTQVSEIACLVWNHWAM